MQCVVGTLKSCKLLNDAIKNIKSKIFFPKALGGDKVLLECVYDGYDPFNTRENGVVEDMVFGSSPIGAK